MSPVAAGLPPKRLAVSAPSFAAVPAFSAKRKPVQVPACLHSKAVFTATQIYPEKSVISGVPATADGAINVVSMPTPQCPSLHTSTALHSGLAQIKSTPVDCASHIVKVPTTQCPRTLCLSDHRLSVKTRPVSARAAYTGSAPQAVNVPASSPHLLAHMSPTGLAQPSLTQPNTVVRSRASAPLAVLSAPPASNAAGITPTFVSPVAPLSHGEQSALCIRPLANHADAWAALPGVSDWVLGIIKRGFSLQFHRRPPRFTARVETSVPLNVAHLLRAEISKLISKGAIELVPRAQGEQGIYSRYFLVPKKDGGIRPILDLRRLNRVLVKRRFKMLTTSKILAHIRREDWFMSIDLKDAYFQIQIASHHRRFLRFAFEGQTYQYTVLPFGLSLAPRTFTKCMDAALAPLRLRGMRVLNYLDDWLILAQSRSQLIEHRAILLDHLENLGITVNWAKSSLNPSQTIPFLGIVLDSQSMTARLSPQRVLNIQRAAKSFRRGVFTPLRKFQRMLGLMASASSVLRLGLLRMRPLQFWLKARVPRRAWVSGHLPLKVDQDCVTALVPWMANDWYQSGVSLGTSSRVRMVSTDASTSGWGALLEGRPFFGLWSEREKLQHINCLEMLAVHNALTRFCPHIKDQHVIVRSDNMAVVSYINRQGGLNSISLYRLAKRLLLWAQHNLRSLRAVHVPGLLNVGPDRLSRNNVPTGEWSLHPQTVRLLWERFGKAEVDLFASHENAHCPAFFSKTDSALSQRWPRCPLYAFPPVSLLPQVLERVRKTKCPVLLVAPFWKNQAWFPVLMQLADIAPWPVPLRRDLLSQARGSIWHPHPELWSLHVWALNGYPLVSQRES